MWEWKYVIVGATACLCYLNTLFGSFVFDDTEAIVKNKDVLPSTPSHQMFSNDFWGTDISLNSSHKSYRPLTVLTFRLNLLLNNSKLDALQFHAVNIILYVSLCLVLIPTFKLLVGGGGRRKSKTAFLSALLFAVHPVHTEVVAGLVGRADILSTVLTLWSLILYEKLIRRESVILFLAVNLLIIAAVLCKETAITAYVLCSTYDVFCVKVLIKDGSSLCSRISSHKNFFYRNLGSFGFSIAILYFRFWIMNFEKPIFAPVDNPAAFSESFLTKVLTYNYIYFLNLLLLIWPQWLCFDWSMGCIPLIESIYDTRVVFVLCLWFLTVFSGYKLFTAYHEGKSSPAALLACALMILPFIPASNIFVIVGFVIAERTLLLPSAGFCLLVILGLNKLSKTCGHKKKVYVGFYILCLIFAFHTIQRNFDWTTEEKLFRSALSVCPLNAKVHYNIAKVAADQSDKNLAHAEYRKAIELNPSYEQAMNNLANLLREDRLFEEAEVLLRKALQIRPNFAAAWMNLGIVLTNLNQSGEAEECYLKAISFRPKYPDCYYNLGNLYLDLKQNEDALKSWEKAVAYRPTHTAAWSNSLVLLDSLYRYNEVLELGKIALMHNPKSPALHFSIANTLGKLKQFEKAEKHFLEALNFNPDNALYYSNLGVLYHRWGKTEKAREMYKKALHLNPNMKTTEGNLKKLLNVQ